jgi:pyridoxal 5'-phosphate synthase pdxT subunit
MIGVLALQGAFLEHLAKFAALGVSAREVRTARDLEGCDGLVLPGGESTAMALIAERLGMVRPCTGIVWGYSVNIA